MAMPESDDSGRVSRVCARDSARGRVPARAFDRSGRAAPLIALRTRDT